jgi:WD40 repeat protein
MHGGERVTSLAYSPDGAVLVSDGGGRLDVWNASTGLLLHRIRPPDDVSAVAFPADGRYLAAAAGRQVLLFDPHDWTATPRRLSGASRDLTSLAVSDDGLLVVAGTGMAEEPSTSTRDAPSADASGVVTPAASPTASRQAPEEALLERWTLPTGVRVTPPIDAGVRVVASIGISPDGALVASGGSAAVHAVTLWDRVSWRRLGQLTSHQDAVTGLAFTRSGSLLLSSSADASLMLWDANGRARVGPPLLGHGYSVVEGLAVSRDGSWAATAGWDGVVGLWDLRVSTLIENGCRLAARNFSQVEWDRFFAGQPYHSTCPELPAGVGAPSASPSDVVAG